jgi:hypothetical protein
MRGRCRLDRDRPDFNPVRALDLEGAVTTNGHARKLSVAAADHKVAAVLSHRKAGAAAGPSAGCE